MSAFFWPTNIKAAPGGIARLGRVLHWLFVAIAAAFVIGGGFSFLTAEYGRESALAVMFFGGGGFFLFARALRYILAGE